MGRQFAAAPLRVLATLIVIAVVGTTFYGAPARAQTSYMLGVDVSHHQNTIDWTKVVESGHVYAFHKATEGATFVDDMYATNRNAAGAEDIPFGAYHFARPDGGGIAAAQADAANEVQHFLAIADPQPGDLIPVLDLEATGGLPPRRLIAWTQAWLDGVESALGVKPLIYTSPSFWSTNLNDTTTFALQGFPLWIAHYTSAAEPRTPAADWNGNGWSFWQWTSCAQVPGIKGCADEDRFPGSDLSPFRIPGAPIPEPSPGPAIPPTNQVPPQISGEAEVGEKLTASSGTWAGSEPISYSYAWHRCEVDGLGCAPVLNGSEPTYDVKPADFGHRMKVTVTATNSADSSEADSAPTQPVTDTTPPEAPRMTNPKRSVTKADRINVGWAPSGQEPVSFEVRYRSATESGDFGDHITFVGPTEQTSSSLDADTGSTYCFSARALDQAGNPSEWSGELCTASPLDDRDLGGKKRWNQRNGQRFYRDTLAQTSRNGRKLIARDVQVREIRLIVQRCRGCGRVAVFFEGRRLDTVDLSARRTINQKVIRIAWFGRERRGDVTIVVMSRDRKVKIDGLALVRAL